MGINKNTTWPQSLHWAHRDSSQLSAKGNASTTKPLAVSSSISNRVRTHMDTRTQWLSSKSMATKACRQRKTWALSSKITTHKDFSNPSRTFWQQRRAGSERHGRYPARLRRTRISQTHQGRSGRKAARIQHLYHSFRSTWHAQLQAHLLLPDVRRPVSAQVRIRQGFVRIHNEVQLLLLQKSMDAGASRLFRRC